MVVRCEVFSWDLFFVAKYFGGNLGDFKIDGLILIVGNVLLFYRLKQ